MDETMSDPCRNCGGCCPVVLFFKSWYDDHLERRCRDVVETFTVEGVIIPFTKSGNCCFLTEDNRCNVYEIRPEMCRNYNCTTDGEHGDMKSWFVRTVKYGSFEYNVTLKMERTKLEEKP